MGDLYIYSVDCSAALATITVIVFVLVVNKNKDLKDLFENWQYALLVVVIIIAIGTIGKQVYHMLHISGKNNI